jgi:hypothetical protein
VEWTFGIFAAIVMLRGRLARSSASGPGWIHLFLTLGVSLLISHLWFVAARGSSRARRTSK